MKSRFKVGDRVVAVLLLPGMARVIGVVVLVLLVLAALLGWAR
jgi:hypothetical protein